MADPKQQTSEMQGLKPLFASIEEAARVLGIRRGKLYLLLQEGKLRKTKIGRRSVISVSELERYAAELMAEAQ